MRIHEIHIALFMLSLFCGGLIFLSTYHEVHDFANYYFGGVIFGEGRFTSDIYFPYWFNQQIVAMGSPPIFAGFAPNSPFLAMLFYPISLLELPLAKLLFNVISGALFINALRRLVKFHDIKATWLLAIPILFFVPLRNEILFGQVYLLIFVLLTEFWILNQRGRLLASGIFLGAAIMLKIFPVLLVLPLFIRKDWKTLASTAVTCLAILLMTLPFVPIDAWSFYLMDILPAAANGEIASEYVDNYQSVFMFLKRLLLAGAENPNGLFNSLIAFSVAVSAFKIIIITVGYFVTKHETKPLNVFAYWIVAMIILSPYGSTYTFIFMLFPFFAILKSDLKKNRLAILLVLLFLMNNLPLKLFLSLPFPLSYLRMIFLSAFFIGLILIFRQLINWKWSFAAVSIMILAVLITHKQDVNRSEMLPVNGPLLIYDYQIENNRLTYKFWENGLRSGSIPLNAVTVKSADLNQNAIYWYGRLIKTGGHKRKPIVVDGRTLYFLSDEGRGPGFYTLRKTEL